MNIKGQRYPIYMLQLHLTHEFHSILLYSQPFSSYSNFGASALNDPKVTFNTKKVKGTSTYISQNPNHHPHLTPESKMPLHFALWAAVLELHAILSKCTEWPPNYPKH